MTRKRKEEIQKEIISVEKKFEDLSFPTLFTGRQVFLKDLLAPEDIWRIVTERKEEDKIFKTTKYVITYEGIKKIAKALGTTEMSLLQYGQGFLRQKQKQEGVKN